MNIPRCLSAPGFFANERSRLFLSTMGNNFKADSAFIPCSSYPVALIFLFHISLNFHSPALKPVLTRAWPAFGYLLPLFSEGPLDLCCGSKEKAKFHMVVPALPQISTCCFQWVHLGALQDIGLKQAYLETSSVSFPKENFTPGDSRD